MANTSHKKMGVLVGVKNLVFAELTEDAASGATYATDLHEVPGTIEVGLTANVSDESLGADDNPVYEVLSSLDSLDVSLNLASLDNDAEAFLLGRTVDGKGALILNSADAAPWVAMGFKASRSDGSEDYIWLYKGKFKQGDMTFHTKEKGTVNWQTPTLSAAFGPRDYDGALMVRVNNKDAKAASILESFFTTVYEKTDAVGG